MNAPEQKMEAPQTEIQAGPEMKPVSDLDQFADTIAAKGNDTVKAPLAILAELQKEELAKSQA